MPFVEVDRGRLYYETYGEGRWLVLIHGAWATHEWWQWQIPQLSRHYRVLALDVRGHGRSSPLQGPHTVAGFANDLAILLRKVGATEVALIGWSMGGVISIEFCLSNPSLVKALILIATRGHRNPTMKRRIQLQRLQSFFSLLMDFADYKGFTYEDQVEREVRSMLSSTTPKEVVDWVMADLTNNPRQSFLEVAKSFWDWEAGEKLRTISVPTLIMVGDKDTRNPPYFSRLLHQLIPNSKLKIFEGCGHFLAQERPDMVNSEIITFLKDIGY